MECLSFLTAFRFRAHADNAVAWDSSLDEIFQELIKSVVGVADDQNAQLLLPENLGYLRPDKRLASSYLTGQLLSGHVRNEKGCSITWRALDKAQRVGKSVDQS